MKEVSRIGSPVDGQARYRSVRVLSLSLRKRKEAGWVGGRTSSRRYSPTSLYMDKKASRDGSSGCQQRSEMTSDGSRIVDGKGTVTYAWWKTMIDVGSSFRVSIVLLAVTPNPSGTSAIE